MRGWGTIFFEGREIQNLTPHAAMQMGIQTIYQEHNLFPLLDVVENLYAGNQITSGLVIDRPKCWRKPGKSSPTCILTCRRSISWGSSSTSARKVIEIAKALVQEAKVIIFDEPTASFSQVEIDHLFEIIRRLAENKKSVIYISHHLEEVFRLADRVTVIRDGEKGIHVPDRGHDRAEADPRHGGTGRLPVLPARPGARRRRGGAGGPPVDRQRCGGRFLFRAQG